ncbi:MAG TPA: adenosylcobinamide-phosphate synthase CbiB [Rhodanobacteraceae bacterium]
MMALILCAGVGLDALLGEPTHGHPLVGFGRFATIIERQLWCNHRGVGVLAWTLSVMPCVVLAWTVQTALAQVSPWLAGGFEVVVLYIAIGMRSLAEHARRVEETLQHCDLPGARVAVACIVGRDTAALDAERVAAAATESVLENGNDATFGALFWCAVLGAPGVVLYRLANTLDAMWGHHTTRYVYFGWMAARADDVLNYLPARLVALTYALCGRFGRAWHCWRTQGTRWISPNAGPVMAAGAGALGVRLGGPASYHGEAWPDRPELGEGTPADAAAIERAVRLVRRGVVLWLIVASFAGAIVWGLHA